MQQNKIVLCGDCGENLGKYRPKFAKDHLRKYPNHTNFIVFEIIDPLSLSNPDDWFKKNKNRFMKLTYQPTFDSDSDQPQNGQNLP